MQNIQYGLLLNENMKSEYSTKIHDNNTETLFILVKNRILYNNS